MKFTEGYWEKSERANASHAMQAFIVEEIPNGMRVIAPFHKITDRAGALDVGTKRSGNDSRKNAGSYRQRRIQDYIYGRWERTYNLWIPQSRIYAV